MNQEYQIPFQIKECVNDIITQVEDFNRIQQLYQEQMDNINIYYIKKDELIEYKEECGPYQILDYKKNILEDQEDSDSNWSDSDPVIVKPSEIKQIIEDEDEVFFENPQDIKTKNEIQIQQNLSLIEGQKEREKRFGCIFQGCENLILVGEIASIMDLNIVVNCKDNHMVLDLDTLLFTEDKDILGRIEDVFGNVNDPHYLLLLDGYLKDKIEKLDIQSGTKVYMIEGYSHLLQEQQIKNLMKKKGCDASNLFDEENIKGHEIEFSDDEQEANYKVKQKQKARKIQNEVLENETQKDQNMSNKKKNKQKKIMIVKNVNGNLQKQYVSEKQFEEMKQNSCINISQVPMQNLQQIQHYNQQQNIMQNQKQQPLIQNQANISQYYNQKQQQQYQYMQQNQIQKQQMYANQQHQQTYLNNPPQVQNVNLGVNLISPPQLHQYQQNYNQSNQVRNPIPQINTQQYPQNQQYQVNKNNQK